MHWFVPYIKDKGIRDIYPIRRVRTVKDSEVQNSENGGIADLRLAFELGERKTLFNEYTPHTLKIDYSFTDTTIGELEK